MKLPDWKTCAGYLLVIAAIALSLPGVRVVRADDAGSAVSVNRADSGPRCERSAESGVSRSVAVFLEIDADPSEEPDPIVLDSQGYSYIPPNVDPEARRLERH